MSAAELWARLSADNLVIGERPQPKPVESAWYVRLMLGIAGWMGALFLLAFVGATLSFVVDDAASAIVAGIVSCAGAFALFRSLGGQDAAEQFALALSLAGQGLMIIGLAQIFDWDPAVMFFAIAAVELGLALLIPQFLHRFLTAGGCALALTLAVNELELHGLATPLLCVALASIWLDPGKWARGRGFWRPIGYGLVLAIMLIELFRLFGGAELLGSAPEKSWMAIYGPLIGRGLSGAVLIWTAASIAIREGLAVRDRTFMLAIGAAVLSGLLSLVAPGLAPALLILLLGYAAGNRLLAGAGIVSLLGFTAHYYSSLHASLLSKSGILAVTGLVLLTVCFFLRRRPAEGAEASHA